MKQQDPFFKIFDLIFFPSYIILMVILIYLKINKTILYSCMISIPICFTIIMTLIKKRNRKK